MTIEIDWSKAPEGATHYYKNSPQPWRDLSGYNWKYFSSGEWHSGPSVCTSDELRREIGKVLFAKPLTKPWTGEGLPPIGAVCEIRHSGWASGNWQNVTIKYISSEYLIIAHGDFKREQHFHMPDIAFRQIRTPEQIAADEREAGITEMREVAGSLNTSPFAELWDAGYRKQPEQ